jgi:secreted trypsin-like serine protease
MRPRNIIFAIIIFLLLINTTNAGTRDPETPDKEYIEFGKKFPFVAALVVVDADNALPPDLKLKPGQIYFQSVYRCSAVAIRPNWALTAAHVVNNSVEQTLIINFVAHPVDKVIPHPNYNSAPALVGYNDIALCYSTKDFDLPFYPALYADNDEVLKSVTISGYGATGTFDTGWALRSDRLRRAGHSRITRTFRDTLICQPRAANKFPLEFLVAPGDSGGGLFIDNRLAGINCCVFPGPNADETADGTLNDLGAHTRISLYIDWIESEIAKYEAAR